MRVPASLRLAPHAMVAVAVVLAVGACSDEQAGDTEEFCARVRADRESIVAPELTDQADIDAHLTIYRQLADVAPLAIDEHWGALLVAYETMSTVDPNDAESEQRALARIYATEPSAIAVRDYVLATCEVDLGPLATVTGAPPAAPTVPATVPSTGQGGG